MLRIFRNLISENLNMRDFIPPSPDQIPDLHAAEPIPDAARQAIADMLVTADLFRYTAQTSPVALLEAEFAAKLGATYALAVSSCSAALFLALKALALPPGARVLIPAFTFAAVPSAVVHAGCVPVLVEVGQNYRVDPDDLAAKAADADAILISHMRGHTSDMDAILRIAEARNLPLVEDAAHSLGTTWNGKNIGTLGRVGCYSFQSYKMLNAGEGGMLITDDPELIARAVIMSGAYEHNWEKHDVISAHAERWQNKLPLYNMRLQNLAAAAIRPQLEDLDRRVQRGRDNHDYVADRLNAHPALDVPAALPGELRAPDSIQFNLVGLSDEQVDRFQDASQALGVPVQVFGRSTDNARAFWNWEFLGAVPDLPQTRKMVSRACDVRLPVRLTREALDVVTDILLTAADRAKRA